MLSSEFDWPGAEKAFRRAIELNPGLSSTYTIYTVSTLRPLGRQDEALRLLREALEYDPLSLPLQRDIGMVQYEAGLYKEAIETLERVHQVDPNMAVETLARALTLAGRPADALPVFERSDQLGGRPRRNPGLALAYVLLGRRAEAEALAKEHEEARAGAGNPFALATIYAALGDSNRAFEALERLAVLEPHRVPRLLGNPMLAGLRGDPRFTALRKRFNLP